MTILDGIRPVWAEISLDNLAYNIKEVRRHIRKEALICAVVKSNAYGHGSIDIARTFLDNGADSLAVAILGEALELRKSGVEEPIMILGYTPRSQYKEVIENDIIQTIYTYEDARVLSSEAKKIGKKATIHIKIDSGMGRIGFDISSQSVEEILKISKLPYLFIEGIYTHFSEADVREKAYTRIQFEKFNQIIRKIEDKGLKIPIKHVANSASIIELPEYDLDMVRAGIMIYGYYPSDEVNKKKIKLRPAMTLKTKISHVKFVPKGTGISYRHSFITDVESKIATIPIGYGDGFNRLLSGKIEVNINGQRVKVAGRICMDQCMVDVTNISDVNIGDEVIIFGFDNESYSQVDEIANLIGSVNYEILCMIGRRIPRVYISKGEIVKVRDYLLD